MLTKYFTVIVLGSIMICMASPVGADTGLIGRIEALTERAGLISVGDDILECAEVLISGEWTRHCSVNFDIDFKYGIFTINTDGVKIPIADKLGFMENVYIDLNVDSLKEGSLIFNASF